MTEEGTKVFDVTTTATLLVDELVTALINSRIYQLEHPRLQASLTRVLELVGELAELSGNDHILIACSEGMVFYGEKPLVGASLAASRLITLFELWEAGGIEIARQASSEQLAVFFACLLEKKQQEDEGFAAVNARAAQRQCIHISLLPAVGQNASPATTNDDAKERSGLQDYQTAVDMLQGVTVSLCRGGTIDFAPVLAQAESILTHLEHRGSTLLGLARRDQYDAFTFGHSIRVAILAMNFARTLTTERDLQIRIGAAALLHDVGKSLVPFEILHSTKRLSDDERREMSRHSELGAQCLLDHHDSDPLAIASAFAHHLSPDGSGYPETIHNHPITWITSIVKICDIFEALTAARPYKSAMSPIRAYRVMLSMGDKINRPLLRSFIDTNGIYPVGQTIQLADDEVAVVTEQTDDPLHPIVQVVEDRNGPIETEEDEFIDLRDVRCPSVRIILGELANDRPVPSDEPTAP